MRLAFYGGHIAHIRCVSQKTGGKKMLWNALFVLLHDLGAETPGRGPNVTCPKSLFISLSTERHTLLFIYLFFNDALPYGPDDDLSE